jgi:hypothetical protein
MGGAWEQMLPTGVGSLLGFLGGLFVFWLGLRHDRRRQAEERAQEVLRETDERISEAVSLLMIVWMELQEHSKTLDQYAKHVKMLWVYRAPKHSCVGRL